MLCLAMTFGNQWFPNCPGHVFYLVKYMKQLEICFLLYGGVMNSEVIKSLNKILKELNLNFMYTISKNKIKIIIFMENL